MHRTEESSSAGDRRRNLVVGTLVWTLLLLASSPAAMADTGDSRPPLKLTFVDAAPDRSAEGYDKLLTIVGQSDDIALTEGDDFLYQGEEFGVTRETLAGTGGRMENREKIRRTLRAAGLEGVVVYRRESDTIHLVVLGPEGRELRHFRVRPGGSQLSDDEAVGALRDIFDVLVPEVQAFRGNGSDSQAGSSEASTASDGSSGATGESSDIREEAIREHRRKYGNLQPGLDLQLQPIFGRRQLNMADRSDYKLQHVTPLVGAGVHLDAVFGVFSGGREAIGGTLYGSWAPFRTNFGALDQPVPGRYLHGGAGIRYIGGLSRRFLLYGEVGGRATRIGLESNEFYAGSTYLTGAGGLGAVYRFSDAARARFFAGGLPVLHSETHGGAFGPAAFTVGAEGRARFTFRIAEPWIVSAFYHFQLFAPAHPNPPDHAGPVDGLDTIHVGGLGAGVEL